MTNELSPHDWLHTVLRRQGLKAPDGRPLYAYRIELDEFSILRMILFGDAVSSRERCALFCIYIAEWWRKRYDGGSWSWSEPLASLDLIDDYTRLYRPIQRGLEYWRRPLSVANGARQFLVTLCCEGGLPLNLLAHESHALGDFFRRLLDEQARSELPRAALPAVASHIAAATLSPRLRSDQVHELASDLVDAVSQLRPHLPDSGDPIEALDRAVPGWRDRMPLDLADRTAMRLFQALARQAAAPPSRGPSPLRVAAELHRVGDAWRLRRWIDLPRQLTAGALQALLGREPLAQMQLYAAVDAGRPKPLALASRFGASGPRGPRFMIERGDRPMELKATDGVELVAVFGELTVGPVSLPNGEPFTALPWVFVPVDDADDGAVPEQWRLHGQGSVRARSELVVVAIDAASTWHAGPEADAQLVGELAGLPGARSLILLRAGVLVVTTPGGECSIHVRATEEAAPSYTLVGARLSTLGRDPAIFLGVPAVEIHDPTGHRVRVQPRDLEWRSVGQRAPWAPMSARAIGHIEVRHRVRGELRWWSTLRVLPSATVIDIEPSPRRGEGVITLRDADEVHAHLSGPPEVDIALRSAADGRRSWDCRAEGPVAAALVLSIVCRSGQTLQLRLPFPGVDACFVDVGGHRLPDDASLFLDHLSGFIARVTGAADNLASARLEACLQVRGRRNSSDFSLDLRPRRARSGQAEVPLGQLLSWSRLALASSTYLDAQVRLTLHDGAGGTTSASIRRYDIALEPDHATGEISIRDGDLSPEVLSRLRLECFPFWDPSRPPEPLPELGPGRWRFITEQREPGPWLIVARDGDWCRARPLRYYIHPATEALDPQAAPDARPEVPLDRPLSLAEIIDLPNERLRSDAHHDLLRAMVADPEHPDWELLLCYARTVGDLPASTFEVIRALTEHPTLAARCAVEIGLRAPERFADFWDGLEDLPFFWRLVPFSSWRAAVQRQTDLLREGLKATPLDPAQVEQIVGSSVRAVLELIESRSLGLEVVAEGVEDAVFGPTERPSVRALARSKPGAALLTQNIANDAQDLLRRHADAHWPPGTEFRGILEEHGARFSVWDLVIGALPPAIHHRQPVLLAPLLAACMCGYDIPASPALAIELRRIHAFDPEWFDLAYAPTLALALADPPGHR